MQHLLTGQDPHSHASCFSCFNQYVPSQRYTYPGIYPNPIEYTHRLELSNVHEYPTAV
jgi:hypothetical protein